MENEAAITATMSVAPTNLIALKSIIRPTKTGSPIERVFWAFGG
jgi:hypothetical protein